MAKKEKLQDPLRKEKLVATGILSVLVIGVVAIIAYFLISQSYFLKIDGKKVASDKEFRLYLMMNASMYQQFGMSLSDPVSEDGTTLLDMVKESTLEELIRLKVVEAEAKKQKLPFTEEQQTNYDTGLADFSASLGEEIISNMQLSNKEVISIYETSLYDEAMFAEITKDYTQDEAALKTYVEKFVEDSTNSYTTILVEFIDTESIDIAAELQQKLEDGEDFEELFRIHSPAYLKAVAAYDEADAEKRKTEEMKAPEDMEMGPVNITNLSLTEAHREAVYSSDVGEFFISDDEEKPYVFRVSEIEAADLVKMTEDATTKFDSENKEAIFADAYEIWREAHQVDYNMNAYNSIMFKEEE